MTQYFPHSSSYPLPPQPPRHPLLRGPAVLIGSIALGLALLCLVLLYSGTIGRFYLAIQPSCTVGLTGTAATMTIQAWSANNDCTALVNNQPSFLGSPAAQSGTFYLYTSTPDNPEVCEVDDQGRHLIVRDEGVLKYYGNVLCQALEQQVQQLQTPTSVYETATAQTEAQAQAQATQTTQAELDQAVNQANQQLAAAMNTLSRDTQTLAGASDYSDALAAYAKDWQQMQKDYQQEEADFKNGCGNNGYNASVVSYDASVVDYDLSVIPYDDGTLQYDENSENGALSPVQQDISQVQTDWRNLQTAAANDNGTVAPAYTQDQITRALTNAQNQVTTSNQATQDAASQGASYDKKAAQLDTKAQNLANSLHC